MHPAAFQSYNRRTIKKTKDENNECDLAVCSDTFCAMVSDGRYVEEPITGEKPILKNDSPKVRQVQVNRNVGSVLRAIRWSPADHQRGGRVLHQYLTLEKVVKILREKAATVSVQLAGVRLIVVGAQPQGGVFTHDDDGRC